MEEYSSSQLTRLFEENGLHFDGTTITENGDFTFKNLDNPLLDILFKTDYYRNNLHEVPELEKTAKNLIFAEFIRDPRFGFGERDLGRHLLKMMNASFKEILMCGRGDDLWKMYDGSSDKFDDMLYFIKSEIDKGSELSPLIKKWMPRFATHNTAVVDGVKTKKPFTKDQIYKTVLARKIANKWGMNKQQYTKYVKCDDTTESKLSSHNEDGIKFEHVPSLAAIKYAPTFTRNERTKKRYSDYLADVAEGKKTLHVATTTVYDIYKNRDTDGFDATLWFNNIEKPSLSIVPIVDTSGSMLAYDCIGKAISIGHYLSKCSTYCKNQFITFSETPSLVNIKGNTYNEEIDGIYASKFGMTTNMEAVAKLLMEMKGEMPDYIVVLSDMQWNEGSRMSVDKLDKMWKAAGIKTKLIWWNFRCKTTPFKEESGHIFLSGYNPILLKFLESGFDGNMFLDKLLTEYVKSTNQSLCLVK